MMSEQPNIVRNPAICCSSCGYRLVGLVVVSQCPECGASVSQSVSAYRLTQSGRASAWRGAATGVVYAARFLWSAVLLIFVSDLLAGLGVCASILLLFGSVVSIGSAGAAFRYERSDVHSRWHQRIVGYVAIALVIGTLAAPVLLALLSGALGTGGEYTAFALATGWFLTYVGLHALVALGLRDAAKELQQAGVARVFACCAAGMAFGVIVVILTAVGLGFDIAFGRVPSVLQPLLSGAPLAAGAALGLGNIAMWAGASRLRKHLAVSVKAGPTE
jgi:predicted RNA-binding Zn-ribbon protein involved in translation (DUF1610 family)